MLDPSSEDSHTAASTPVKAAAPQGEKLIATRMAVAKVLKRADEPKLKWSNTQGREFRDCPRSRYWSTLAAEAWREGALAVAVVARRLKTLTSLDLAAGNAVHDRATETAAAIREAAPRPPFRRMWQQCIAFMHAVSMSSCHRFDDWYADPTQKPKVYVLMERYYRRGFSRTRGRQVEARMERAVVTLENLALWAELAACDPATILTPGLTKYVLPDVLGVEPVLVWAVPDLVFRLPDDGPWVVCDFKTGRVADRRAFESAKDQVVSYAAWLRHGLGVLGPDDACEGRLLLLSDGTEETWTISPADIDAAEVRIRNEALALDAARARADRAGHEASGRSREAGAPIDALPAVIERGRRSEYAMTPNRKRCQSCFYQELCAPEQQEERNSANDGEHAA
jgi:hypothetical protein